MWERLDFAPLPTDYPRVERFAAALSSVYVNGRVVHRAFRLPVDPVFDWYSSRNRFYEMAFFERLWTAQSVQVAIPQQLRPVNFSSNDVFEWSSPLMLSGSLAWALAAGGAYQRHQAGTLDAKRLADAAAEELLVSDYDSALLFISHVAWSDFFFDVAWDSTWVLINTARQTVNVLLGTDTD